MVVTTVATEAVARELGRKLVDRRLAACVSILPAVASIYRWEGKLCEEGEFLLWIKTTAAGCDRLVETLLLEHPYQLPEILVLATGASRAYGDWVAGEVLPA